MDKRKKLTSIIPLYNSMSEYQNYFIRNAFDEEIEDSFSIKSIRLAALSMITLNIILLKEDVVENEGNLEYSSKVDEDYLKLCFCYIAKRVDEDHFKLGNNIDTAPKLFAMIRNKIAHGDYYITDKSIILNKMGGAIEIDIDLFIRFFNELNEHLFLTTKSNTYTKKIVYNKHSDLFNKKLETEKDVEEFLKLCYITSYTITSKNKEEIPRNVKIVFENELKRVSNSFKKMNDNKILLQPLIDEFYKHGYIVTIENQKIKDLDLIEKIKDQLLNVNEYFEEIDPSILQYVYGDKINKIVEDMQMNKKGLIMASRINIVLLSQMITLNGEENLEYLITNMLNDTTVPEIMYLYINDIMASILLAKFINSYAYCLDDVFKIDNNYHLNRDDLLDFGKLDLSELNPSILEINTRGKEEAEQSLKRAIHKKDEVEEKIERLKGYIEGLSRKKELSEKELKKLEEFKEQIPVLKRNISVSDMDIENKRDHYNKVLLDYEENYNYFKNLAIIEGIRNSIAHGNVEIINDYKYNRFNFTKLKFTNKYEGRIVFEMTAGLYELESLFEEVNVQVINDFEIKNNVLKKRK